ncbi:glucose-6-phosphate isomerase [Tepidimonas sp. HKU77]|nr:glucose-6-phosphate isomerase [uncultured Tepidimonas sp.]
MSHTPVFVPPQRRRAWQSLQALADQPRPHLRTLLAAADPERTAALQFHAAGLTLDATRQAITLPIWHTLLALAQESDVQAHIEAMWRGEPVNPTEGRAALHVALRGGPLADPPWGQTIQFEVRAELARFLDTAERIRDGQWRGSDGQPVRHVVNLGIGGSDLGPRMAVRALAPERPGPVRVHFVSNVDAHALHDVLQPLDPRQTLFIVQSKTFTTQETLTLAASARRWLANAGIAEAAQQPHWIAVTAHPERAQAWGVPAAQIHRFWDWVGGRYSLWSAIGLPLAIAIGRTGFEQLLAGGHAVDEHVRHAPPARNLPLALALLGVWNRNFLRCPTLAVAVYSARLDGWVPFQQQLEMESNGKSVHVDGSAVAVDTCPIVWGGLGNDGQHAYFQLLHQGTHRIAVDFIGVQDLGEPLPLGSAHARVVRNNLLAQAQALAEGRDEAATAAALRAEGLDEVSVARMTPHRTYRGNVPSNLIWLPRLDPYHLGALIAAHEHKVFYQAVLWGIHPFDQWGVELGKTLAQQQPGGNAHRH